MVLMLIHATVEVSHFGNTKTTGGPMHSAGTFVGANESQGQSGGLAPYQHQPASPAVDSRNHEHTPTYWSFTQGAH